MNSESKQVLLLINQFLCENNLHDTAQSLQKECKLNLSTASLSNRNQIHSSIKSGNWVTALELLSTITLSPPTKTSLNIQIILELCENGEASAAQSLLRSLTFLKTNDAERYLKLEQICVTQFQKSYYKTGRDGERKLVAELVESEIEINEPGRLLTLLGQAVKNKISSGEITTGPGDLDFMKNRTIEVVVGDEDLPACDEYTRVKVWQRV
jgi:hypothetical protein